MGNQKWGQYFLQSWDGLFSQYREIWLRTSNPIKSSKKWKVFYTLNSKFLALFCFDCFRFQSFKQNYAKNCILTQFSAKFCFQRCFILIASNFYFVNEKCCNFKFILNFNLKLIDLTSGVVLFVSIVSNFNASSKKCMNTLNLKAFFYKILPPALLRYNCNKCQCFIQICWILLSTKCCELNFQLKFYFSKFFMYLG
jgi:hypothetical protein